jgi:hypothetical protein
MAYPHASCDLETRREGYGPFSGDTPKLSFVITGLVPVIPIT